MGCGLIAGRGFWVPKCISQGYHHRGKLGAWALLICLRDTQIILTGLMDYCPADDREEIAIDTANDPVFRVRDGVAHCACRTTTPSLRSSS